MHGQIAIALVFTTRKISPLPPETGNLDKRFFFRNGIGEKEGDSLPAVGMEQHNSCSALEREEHSEKQAL